MGKKFLTPATLALTALGATLPVYAATINVGHYNIEDTSFADTAYVASGVIYDVSNVIGADLNTAASGFGNPGREVIRFGFTDNAPINGSGYGLLVFELYTTVENHRNST